jgi:hypothetical protein
MRRILLTLADDTTDEFCGSCTWYEDARCHQWNLVAYNERRVPECLAAERAAGELVAITREDAALAVSCAEACDTGVTDEEFDAYERIVAALRAHAKGEP